MSSLDQELPQRVGSGMGGQLKTEIKTLLGTEGVAGAGGASSKMAGLHAWRGEAEFWLESLSSFPHGPLHMLLCLLL
jgi:hypothetical protein